MKKRILLLFGLTLCFILTKAQQAPQFSQYVFDGLYINPAYAGYKEDINLNSFYSSQWTGLDGAPQTQSVAADGIINDGHVGLGLIIQHDQVGAQSNITAYGNYAYRVQLGDNDNSKLSFGLGFGFLQSGIDGTKLNPVQTNDAYIPTGNESVVLPDARFGVLYTNDNFFAGVSIDNFLAPYIHTSEIKTFLVLVPKPNEYLTAGALFDLSDEVKFKPSILIRNSPDNPTSTDINTYFLLYNKFWVGGTYRTSVDLYNKPDLQNGYQKSSAMVFMLEFFASENIRIGYSFDYSLNNIGNNGYGTNELSLSILLKRNKGLRGSRQYFF